MLYEEALETIKRALVQQGKDITKLQEKVLPLILKKYSYNQMATELSYQYSYLKDVVSNFCKLLSQAFGFKVTKLNLYSSLVQYAEQKQMCNLFASSQPNWVD